MVVAPARDARSRPPRGSANCGPSAPTSSGALSIAAVGQRDPVTPSASRSTDGRRATSTADHPLGAGFGAVAASAARKWRFSCIQPKRLVVVRASKCEAARSRARRRPAIRRIGQPGAGRKCAATPIVSQHPHRARRHRAGASVERGSLALAPRIGRIDDDCATARSSRAPRRAPARPVPPPKMMTSARSIGCARSRWPRRFQEGYA